MDQKTDEELHGLLMERLAATRSLSWWARLHNFEPSHISKVVHGEKSISPRLAAALGYRPVEKRWEKA